MGFNLKVLLGDNYGRQGSRIACPWMIAPCTNSCYDFSSARRGTTYALVGIYIPSKERSDQGHINNFDTAFPKTENYQMEEESMKVRLHATLAILVAGAL